LERLFKYCAPERQKSFTDVSETALEQERKQARTDLFDTTAVEGFNYLLALLLVVLNYQSVYGLNQF
jgi:hypothetical protein